ncbi:MAG: hypothetical protein QG620_782 [Patescibacteria group bacterium]|nr:hypothetical protein [Patescibacteria group bacterium]
MSKYNLNSIGKKVTLAAFSLALVGGLVLAPDALARRGRGGDDSGRDHRSRFEDRGGRFDRRGGDDRGRGRDHREDSFSHRSSNSMFGHRSSHR